MERRDMTDPRYKTWRNRVYARDKYTCKMPGCAGGDKRLEAHHIKRWAEFPTLRYVTSNGITLCKNCHDHIWNREDEFETVFQSLVSGTSANHMMQILMLKHGRRNQENS